jgi:hypothetical protein
VFPCFDQPDFKGFAMSNLLAAVTPKLLAQGLLALRQTAVMPQLVNSAYDTQAGERGSTIDVPIPSAIAVQVVVPANIPPTTSDVTPSSVPIPLANWYEAPFYLTDKDILTAMDGVIPMQASEAIKSLANQVNNDILALGNTFYGISGTAGTTPFSPASQSQTTAVMADTRDATNIRKVLNKQLAPMDDRHVVFNPDAEAAALNLRAFQDVSWNGDIATIRDGKLNQKLGFQWLMHQLVQSHVSGTATGITLSANAAVGDGNAFPGGTVQTVGGTPTGNPISLKASGAGTLVVGDIITFAGDLQTYVVTSGASLSTTAATVYIYPGLQVAQPTATVTPVATTLIPTHVMNLAFQKNAIAFATRPLANVYPGLGAITETAADPLSGLTLRLEITRQHKQVRFSYDILYGCATVRRELGARLLG